MRFTIRPFTEADADGVASWRYPPPYDAYDVNEDPSKDDEMRDPDRWGASWFAVDDAESGELAGFLELVASESGSEAGTQEVEVGLGLRPDLTGRWRRRGVRERRPRLLARALVAEVVRARCVPVERARDPLLRTGRLRAGRGVRPPVRQRQRGHVPSDGAPPMTPDAPSGVSCTPGVTCTPRRCCSSRYSERRRNVSRSSSLIESTNWSR